MWLDICVLFYYRFYRHVVLFRTLKFTRLFAVRFMCCAWKFYPFGCKYVCSSYCFYADLKIYEFCNLKRIITVTTVVEGPGLQTRCLNMSKPRKDEDSRDLIGCSGLSKTQKVQRIHQLECSYASIMLSLRYYLLLFYTNYASAKKQCYVVSCSSVYFLPPQIMGTIRAMV